MEESEPKETAVMIRTLCIVDIQFLLITAILAFFNFGKASGFAILGFMMLIVVTLFLTYKVRMNVLIYAYFAALVVNVIYLVSQMGLSYMFQSQLYVCFMIFFYRAAGSKRERIVSVVVSAAIVMCLIFYVNHYGHALVVLPYGSSVATFFCTVYIVSKVATIAYFFRLKFSASEEKIIKYSRKLELLATIDPLTKLQNRRGMLNHIEQINREVHTVDGGLMTIVIGDIDLFKSINDTYGHEAGDYVLETLAKIMNEFMDSKGMVSRWGGEEFLFSFEGINGDYAFQETSKLLHLIEKYEFSYEGTPINVTMTFGVEEYDESMGIDKIISRADEKLYMGKKQGRNRVIY